MARVEQESGRSALYRDELSMPVASLGPANPLPPLKGLMEVPVDLTGSDLPRRIREGAAYGALKTSMPYLIRDAYGRDRAPGTIPAVVLENDVLRATFVPSLGGRLWSLRHRPTGRDLLFSNSVFQPVNFGVCNAWFAGGVEWNVGTHGHSPATCAPLHSAAVTGPDGSPVLRMWEFDRLHGTIFSFSAWLPPGSPVLFVHGRILNPGDETAPTYCWANAAVPETDRVRIVTPASRAYWTSLERTLDSVPFPARDGVDYSYPARAAFSTENYCEVPEERPWAAALDESGIGLAQASTPALRGRKTFAWGNTVGCRHWQSWLTGDGQDRYCEFQSGLTTTQYEHVAVEPKDACSWTEAYGLLQVDPELVHGDWPTAVAAVERRLDTLVTATALDEAHRAMETITAREPHEFFTRGSGWGALERRRADAASVVWPEITGTPFGDDTLGDEQAPWLALLETGELPASDVADAPLSYVTGDDWRARLSRAPRSWLTEYLLGALAHARHDLATAERYYLRSIGLESSAWALRALALVRQAEGDEAGAVQVIRQACELAPRSLPLAIEGASMMLAADDLPGCLRLLDNLDDALLENPRLRLIRAIAAKTLGDDTSDAAVLAGEFTLPTMRSSEILLERLWFLTFPDRPLPDRYNFRWNPLATDQAMLENIYGKATVAGDAAH
ncbi:DUF5107 domain-containing protein [Amycolatopsis sp. NPDC059021]|uniref:DUF5107 domain-containing protein n=1 Tax=Amycolatopsis sp. NPDC059021 TaxID=3346704 RepID=UPI00366E1E8F